LGDADEKIEADINQTKSADHLDQMESHIENNKIVDNTKILGMCSKIVLVLLS
jgi:hypothetical protein